MMTELLTYGPHSPFDTVERETVGAVVAAIERSDHAERERYGEIVLRQIESLEALGEVVSRYPSPAQSQTLGDRERGLNTLVETLSQASHANFEIYLPTRAYLGRAIVMAESNFYRLLRHICDDVVSKHERRALAERVDSLLRRCLYTRLCEDVLTSIASDREMPHDTRAKAIIALATIWDQQLSYRLAKFFPLLEATWEARQRTIVTGGTLGGASEMLELLQAGCDPEFVGFFSQSTLGEDELAAFREFLFGRTTEKLSELAREMEEAGVASCSLDDTPDQPRVDAASVLFEFFRRRHLQAQARRLGGLAGPKRTAEEYVMIHYLDGLDSTMLANGGNASDS